jgi:hypothetical protein
MLRRELDYLGAALEGELPEGAAARGALDILGSGKEWNYAGR